MRIPFGCSNGKRAQAQLKKEGSERMKEPYLAHSELTGAIYIVVSKDKYEVTEQAKQAVKAVSKKATLMLGKWNNHEHYICSACQHVVYFEPCYHFCPMCGVEWREVEK
jgi:rubrerythrin